MDLILIRHGLPERSAVSSDPPLSEKGRAQAARVAAHLAAEAIDAVWASTMKRAVETGEPLARNVRLELLTHHGICEYDRGGGQYVPTEVLKVENYEAWKAIADNADGVDMRAFQASVVEGLEHIIGAHPGGRVAVFCHGGVINVWTAHILGMEPRIFFDPAYTSINRFACARSGIRSIVSLNEHAHLRDLH